MAVELVISGGQTGVDQIGLEVAQAAGLATGGWAPAGFRTEKGPQASLGTLFRLWQTAEGNYQTRTRLNAKWGDGTVWFGSTSSSGYYCTAEPCLKLGKPFLTNPTIEVLRDWLEYHKISVLNVAGNRASKLSPAHAKNARTVLTALLGDVVDGS